MVSGGHREVEEGARLVDGEQRELDLSAGCEGRPRRPEDQEDPGQRSDRHPHARRRIDAASAGSDHGAEVMVVVSVPV
jgi:hypothetical protein